MKKGLKKSNIKINTGYENSQHPGHEIFQDTLRFLIGKVLAEETALPSSKKGRAVARRRERKCKAIAFQKYYGKKSRYWLKRIASNSLAYRRFMQIIWMAKHR